MTGLREAGGRVGTEASEGAQRRGRGSALVEQAGARDQRQNSSNAWPRREGQNRSRSVNSDTSSACRAARRSRGSSGVGITCSSCVADAARTTTCPRCGMSVECPDFCGVAGQRDGVRPRDERLSTAMIMSVTRCGGRGVRSSTGAWSGWSIPSFGPGAAPRASRVVLHGVVGGAQCASHAVLVGEHLDPPRRLRLLVAFRGAVGVDGEDSPAQRGVQVVAMPIPVLPHAMAAMSPSSKWMADADVRPGDGESGENVRLPMPRRPHARRARRRCPTRQHGWSTLLLRAFFEGALVALPRARTA